MTVNFYFIVLKQVVDVRGLDHSKKDKSRNGCILFLKKGNCVQLEPILKVHVRVK